MTSQVANTNLTSQIYEIESLEGLLARDSESLAIDSGQLSIRPALMVLEPAKGPLRLYWEISLTITALSQLLSSNTSSSEKHTMLETCLASLLDQRAQLKDILNQHSSSQRIKNSLKINRLNRQLCNHVIDYLKDPNHPSESVQKFSFWDSPKNLDLYLSQNIANYPNL